MASPRCGTTARVSGPAAGRMALPTLPSACAASTRKSGLIETYLAFTDGQVAGYCSLGNNNNDPQAAWIPLLNVSPQFQGRGLGRDLLKRALAHTCELGCQRLSLGTWGGQPEVHSALQEDRLLLGARYQRDDAQLPATTVRAPASPGVPRRRRLVRNTGAGPVGSSRQGKTGQDRGLHVCLEPRRARATHDD